jgi:hypothetical protein
MSILDFQIDQQKSRDELIAKRLKAQPAIRFKQFLSTWEADIKALWSAPDPQAVLDFIGPMAGELFQVSGKTGMYLESLKPGCTSTAMALVGKFEINHDGTVTIISKPAQ